MAVTMVVPGGPPPLLCLACAFPRWVRVNRLRVLGAVRLNLEAGGPRVLMYHGCWKWGRLVGSMPVESG